MRLHWTFSGCDTSDQSRIDELWQSRQRELEAKAAGLGETERSHLRIAVEQSESSPLWTVRAALYLSSHAFASERADDDLAETLDQIVGDLSQQVDERLDQPISEGDGRSGLERLVPFLGTFHGQQRSDAFFLFIMPLIRSLRRFAQREIRTRRMLGELHTEQLTVSDVLDEAMLRAWNRYAKKPKDRALDLWLIQLIDEVIEDGSRTVAQESLNSRQRQPSTEPRGSWEDQWVDDPTEPVTIEASRLLPGEPGIQAWDDLDVETKQAHLDEIFERLSRSQRQVLMLYAVEGFGTAAIADFQDRPQAEVEQDLAGARSILQRMASEWELPDIEERLERASFKRPSRSHRT